MKKKYISGILMFMMMVAGVGCAKGPKVPVTPGINNPAVESPSEQNGSVEVESKMVLLENAKVDGKSLVFSVKNGHAEGNLSYANPYVILALGNNGQWEFTDFTNELSFTAEVNFVEAQKSVEGKIDLSPIWEKLEVGKSYRVAKNVGVEGITFLYEARIDIQVKDKDTLEVKKSSVIELPAPELPEGDEMPLPVETEQTPVETPETPVDGK